MGKTDREFEGSVITEKRQKIEKPPLYKVMLHNDDYTAMEFVVIILEKIFHRSTVAATRIMLNVHNQGIGLAGVYTREVAETKVDTVHSLAHRNEYPLRCSMEKI